MIIIKAFAQNSKSSNLSLWKNNSTHFFILTPALITILVFTSNAFASADAGNNSHILRVRGDSLYVGYVQGAMYVGPRQTRSVKLNIWGPGFNYYRKLSYTNNSWWHTTQVWARPITINRFFPDKSWICESASEFVASRQDDKVCVQIQR